MRRGRWPRRDLTDETATGTQPTFAAGGTDRVASCRYLTLIGSLPANSRPVERHRRCWYLCSKSTKPTGTAPASELLVARVPIAHAERRPTSSDACRVVASAILRSATGGGRAIVVAAWPICALTADGRPAAESALGRGMLFQQIGESGPAELHGLPAFFGSLNRSSADLKSPS